MVDGVGTAAAARASDLAGVPVACEYLEAEALPGLRAVAAIGHDGNDASRAGRSRRSHGPLGTPPVPRPSYLPAKPVKIKSKLIKD